MKITQQELNEIHVKHKKWLNDEEGGERADLSGYDLSGLSMRDFNMRFAIMTEALMVKVNMTGAIMRNVNMSYTNMTEAIMRNVNMTEAIMRNVNLSYASIFNVNMTEAIMPGAVMTEALMHKVNMTGTIMPNVNLSAADIRDVIGNRAEIKTILASDVCHIVYTAEILQIGCERHRIEEWWAFTEEEIAEMDGKKAVEFWAQWKDVIKKIIEISPATPTGHEKKAEAAA